MRSVFTILSILIVTFGATTSSVWAVNRALSSVGYGDYVEISESQTLNSINSQVTMEAWIKPTAFPNEWMPLIYKGGEFSPDLSHRSYNLWINHDGRLHLVSAPTGMPQMTLNMPGGSIRLNTWQHVAGVVDAKNQVMKVFIDGKGIGSKNFGNDIGVSSLPLRIGWSHELTFPSHAPFAGQIDEVRIWNVARTQEEIQATMNTTLTGQEEGLVGYWNFDDDTVIDLSPNSNDGILHGNAQIVEASLPDEFIHKEISVIAFEDKVANPGDQFTMNISVRLTKEMHSFSFKLLFDPSVLKVINVKQGNSIDTTSWQTPAIDNQNGVISNIRCRRSEKEGAGDMGVLASVTFEALDIGSADLTFQNLRLLSPTGEEIKARAKPGLIDVYPHGSISGVVLDAATGKPIKRAKVELSRNNFTIGGLFTYSADDGTYNLRGAPVGAFDVTASKDGYLSKTILKVHVEGGKTAPDISIKLTSLRDFRQ